MIGRVLSALSVAGMLIVASPQATAKEHPWIKYEAKKYGFSMMVPKGTRFRGKEWKNGWGGLHANYWGVKLWGIAHLGKKHTAKEIETFALLVTGVPAKKWKLKDQGKEKNGWEWYKTWEARRGKAVFIGAYGVGPKGSYLLVLRTNKKSYARDKAAYLRWYKSLTVF